MNAYLSKPIQAELLIEMVERLAGTDGRKKTRAAATDRSSSRS